MLRLPRVSGAEAIAGLERLGFVAVRRRGSHVVMKRESATATTGCVVPLHRELKPGTLKGVLRQAGVSVEEFLSVLK